VAEGGADLLELGVPYSDPLADGPIIQAAYTRALEQGTRISGVLETAGRVVEATGLPVVLMTACNPVLAYGQRAFCLEAADAGISGILVPDLLPEDAGSLADCVADAGLDSIYLAAPDTPEERLKAAAEASSGFLYLVSRRGVTGPDGGVGGELEREVERARRHAAVPVAVGFGVTTPDDVARVAAVADGVIVGSALVTEAAERIEAALGEGCDRPAAVTAAAEDLRALTARLASGLMKGARAPGGDER
jgi:tryptophan synthase alpha chain